MLKRNPEPAKAISRPQVIVTQPKSEPAKPQPTPDAGVGGSSLDTMTAACATETFKALRNATSNVSFVAVKAGSGENAEASLSRGCMSSCSAC